MTVPAILIVTDPNVWPSNSKICVSFNFCTKQVLGHFNSVRNGESRRTFHEHEMISVDLFKNRFNSVEV